MTARLLTALMVSAAVIGRAAAAEPAPLAEQGKVLVEQMCARCHATGPTGDSPHPGAPAFRSLDRRIDLDTFTDRLRNGLTSGHPDMPTFRFSRTDARAVVAYLRSIQGP